MVSNTPADLDGPESQSCFLAAVAFADGLEEKGTHRACLGGVCAGGLHRCSHAAASLPRGGCDSDRFAEDPGEIRLGNGGKRSRGTNRRHSPETPSAVESSRRSSTNSAFTGRERKTHFEEEILDMMRKKIGITMEAGGNNRKNARPLSALASRGRILALVMRVANRRQPDLYIEQNLKTREEQAAGTSEFLDTQLREAKEAALRTGAGGERRGAPAQRRTPGAGAVLELARFPGFRPNSKQTAMRSTAPSRRRSFSKVALTPRKREHGRPEPRAGSRRNTPALGTNPFPCLGSQLENAIPRCFRSSSKCFAYAIAIIIPT